MWRFSFVVAFAMLGACVEGRASPGRHVVTVHWDTVSTIGSSGPNDTTLIHPRQLIKWDSLLVTLDFITQGLNAFAPSGRHVWSYTHRGKGAGELAEATAAAPGPDGLL